MTRLSKRQKADADELVAKLTEVVRSFGPLPVKCVDPTEMVLDTKYGLLHVKIRPNLANPGASVYMWFEEPARANDGLGPIHMCNSHSGKWNEFYFDESHAESVCRLRAKLETVCPPRTT